MTNFNYASPAELFTSKLVVRSARRHYQRFDTAAAAIRHLMEDTPKAALAGSVLEVDERRFVGADIQRLYDAAEYPLERRG